MTYSEKKRMIVQRTRPPWLDDRHFVNWHGTTFPTRIETDSLTLKTRRGPGGGARLGGRPGVL